MMALSDIRCWFRHCFTKQHWNLVKTAIKSYPFDYGYMYILEKAKLEDMLNYFSNAHYIAQENYDLYCKQISLAIRLLDIVIEDEYVTDIYVNTRNYERFISKYEYVSKYKGIIRSKKALNLYYKVISTYRETWWD